MQSSRSSCAKSDYSMSKNRTAHSRILLLLFHCAGTIPQSAKLTAPFTQRGLWCGAPPNVRRKIANAPQGDADCHVAALAAPRNDPVEACSCTPRAMDHRPYRHPSGLSPISPVRGDYDIPHLWLPCKGSCQRPKPLTEGFHRRPATPPPPLGAISLSPLG